MRYFCIVNVTFLLSHVLVKSFSRPEHFSLASCSSFSAKLYTTSGALNFIWRIGNIKRKRLPVRMVRLKPPFSILLISSWLSHRPRDSKLSYFRWPDLTSTNRTIKHIKMNLNPVVFCRQSISQWIRLVLEYQLSDARLYKFTHKNTVKLNVV